MRIERKFADTNGKFSINAGVGFCVEPVDGGAVFPLEAHLNADVSAYNVVDDARPLYQGAFSSVEFWGATSGSEWLVYTAETPADIIGATHMRGRLQRLAPQLQQVGAFTPGTYYLGNIDTFSKAVVDTQPVARRPFDVRRFRGVLLSASTAANLISAGAPSFRLYLDCYQSHPFGPDEIANPCLQVAAGSTNELVGRGGGTLWIAVGEHVQNVMDLYYQTVNGRFPYVVPRVEVGNLGGDEIDMDSGIFFDLWGVP